MTTLGAVFVPQLPPERLRAVVRAADDSGLEELWLWEDCFLEGGVATATAALAWSQRLRVGVGLLPVPLRNVALTGMELATLHRLFPGRALVGVGHGVQDWMGQVGARAESPLTLLREYVTALRALLAGERLSVQGRYVRLDGVALDWPPTEASVGSQAGDQAGPLNTGVLVGATGPKTLRLAGEVADGTILTGGTDVDGVRAARRLIDEGRQAAGRDEPHPVVVYLHAATGPDAVERMAAERVRWGYRDGQDVSVAGDAHAVADAVNRWADAGADTVVLQPTPDDPDPEGFLRFVAERVRPLVG
ncbi:LLM class flavin-dependent oxidoreductase [Dactylosporangium aurantiacum]|uniref:LLM class flavin-dependent oxidoreductase n=1 Tax=Dactylosporangium aurantiacum TaxID=35754 RepID=A0A9Q9IIN1_9ACTN|nr:LLM class flavin-dependent oxidoreductase [Dactylosporangium aurantiacum]UWZ56341.1 LLM class flavin-dependent oxidoreductase [Dactylosporangium aurantiacum]